MMHPLTNPYREPSQIETVFKTEEELFISGLREEIREILNAVGIPESRMHTPHINFYIGGTYIDLNTYIDARIAAFKAGYSPFRLWIQSMFGIFPGNSIHTITKSLRVHLEKHRKDLETAQFKTKLLSAFPKDE